MIRLAVRVARADAELALVRLLDLAPAGVEEVPRADGTLEYALYRPDRHDGADVRSALGSAVLGLSVSTVADDWTERWREFHRPSIVGGRVWVRAPWELPAPLGLLDVAIEPAQAFGTGSHATTRLCLELMLLLERSGAAGGPLVDLGCGSGVLAIAAARLGWSPVVAVDHDVESVAATLANAAANRVTIEVHGLDVLRDPLPSAPTATANLLRPLLMELAAVMVDPPRRLILGGLAVDEGDALAAEFVRRHGFEERARRQEGDWIALLLSRDASDGARGIAQR